MKFRREVPKIKQSKSATIHFRTDTVDHGDKAIGIGVYESVVSAAPDEVLLDDAVVEFSNHMTARKALEAASHIESLRKRGTLTDCFGFVALYGAGITPKDVPKNRGSQPWLTLAFKEQRLTADDIKDGDMVALGFKVGAMERPHMVHSLIAAETPDRMMFFHKLGTEGPLALSGLEEVQRLYNSRILQKFEEISLDREV